MIALAVILGLSVAGALALVAWLVHGRVTAADREADARVGQVATEGEVERARFELEVTAKALAAANARAAALEEVIADAFNSNPNSDLARNDVDGRVLRLARSWAEADRDRAVPTEPSEAVPGSGPTVTPGPVVRPGET